jgi:DNA-binding winged helix-turn-helix (wHTH) protein
MGQMMSGNLTDHSSQSVVPIIVLPARRLKRLCGLVLSRAFLMSYGWGKYVTVEHNVTDTIPELKTLLPNKSDFVITTLRSKGYQMVHTNEGCISVKN